MHRRDPSSINDLYSIHEFNNGNFLGYYTYNSLDAQEDVDDTNKTNLYPIERAVMSNTSIHLQYKSTWLPGVLNRRYRAATECILDNQVGEKKWENSTDVTPLDCLEQSESILAEAVEFGCPKCTAESETGEKSSLNHKEKCPRNPTARLCYASYLYTSQHRLDMMSSKDVSLADVAASKFGGVIIFDEDKVATQVLNDGKGMKLEDYILESEPVLPNGETGQWYRARQYLKLVLIKLDYDEDDYLRLAIVIVRTCSMLDTDPSKKWDWDTVAEMGIDARSQLWVQEFCILASSPNTNLITNKSLHRKLDSIFFAWTITVGSSPTTHIAPKALSLMFKNYLEKEDNIFKVGKNGLRKINNFDLFGVHIRNSINRKRNHIGESVAAVTLDKNIYKRGACSLTRAPKGDLAMLETRLLATADMLRSGVTNEAASARHTSFKAYIRDPLSSLFEEAHDTGRITMAIYELTSRQLTPNRRERFGHG